MNGRLEREVRDIIQRSAYNLDIRRRVEMTVSCRDSDTIPKAPDAGKIVEVDGVRMQIMHSGLRVIAGGYYGNWQSEIITRLDGIHEPQEEKVFDAVLKRISPGSVMVECGAFWAYYSLWFQSTVKDGFNYCIEPDSNYLEVGRRNFGLNGYDRVKFIHGAVDGSDQLQMDFVNESDGKPYQIQTVGIDGLIEREKIKRIDILHLDIQGYELAGLQSAIKAVREGRVRFVFVSTHHWDISNDVQTHQKCRQFLLDNGAHLIAEHNVLESYSGDGLLVASFDLEDKDFTVPVSRNTSNSSLYQPYENNLAVLSDAYTSTVSSLKEYSGNIERRMAELESDVRWHMKEAEKKDMLLQEQNKWFQSVLERDSGRFHDLEVWGQNLQKLALELEQRVNSLHGQNNELAFQKNDLEYRLQALRQQHEELEQQHEELEQQHEELEQQHEELEQQHEELEQQHEELEQQHSEQTAYLRKQTEYANSLETGLERAVEYSTHLEQKIQSTESERDQFHSLYFSVVNSRSWRYMRPFRFMMKVFKYPVKFAVVVVFKVVKKIKPLKWTAKKIVRSFPSLDRRLRRFGINRGLVGGAAVPAQHGEVQQEPVVEGLSARGRMVYARLKSDNN